MLPQNYYIRVKSAWQALTFTGKAGFLIIFITAMLALWAPYLSPHPPDAATGSALQPPGGEHLLGTDNMGMDIWSQLCYGARVSLL